MKAHLNLFFSSTFSDYFFRQSYFSSLLLLSTGSPGVAVDGAQNDLQPDRTVGMTCTSGESLQEGGHCPLQLLNLNETKCKNPFSQNTGHISDLVAMEPTGSWMGQRR
jgi:hypothetical protein